MDKTPYGLEVHNVAPGNHAEEVNPSHSMKVKTKKLRADEQIIVKMKMLKIMESELKIVIIIANESTMPFY